VQFKKTRPNSKSSELFKGIKNNSFFYFAHSYYCHSKEPVRASVTDYGIKFTSSLNKGNVWAVQFHPEKSQRQGLLVLKNFTDL